LVEPKLETYNINPDLITEKSTQNQSRFVVHFYGQLAEMDAIHEIAQVNKLLVIEDAAQAHGAIRNLNQNQIRNIKKSSVAYSFILGKILVL
jgi:dTDP-4-amino-4,6-dideoxygalactose transaminase